VDEVHPDSDTKLKKHTSKETLDLPYKLISNRTKAHFVAILVAILFSPPKIRK
jgi:hypothetical protein